MPGSLESLHRPPLPVFPIERTRSAVVVAARPWDEIRGFGGGLARLADAGARLRLVTVTEDATAAAEASARVRPACGRPAAGLGGGERSAAVLAEAAGVGRGNGLPAGRERTRGARNVTARPPGLGAWQTRHVTQHGGDGRTRVRAVPAKRTGGDPWAPSK